MRTITFTIPVTVTVVVDSDLPVSEVVSNLKCSVEPIEFVGYDVTEVEWDTRSVETK